MTTPSKPIEIIGGGLAGLALGVGLRRAGVAVTVFEAGDYPRHRVCGEFIAGLAPETSRKLGIQSVFEGALLHADMCWFIGGRLACGMRLPEAAMGMSRFVLDARLAELFVNCGGTLVPRHRFDEEINRPGRVGAGGRRRHAGSPWVGLKAHVRKLSPLAPLELHVGEGAYVGLSRVEDGWVNVCGLFRRRAGLKGDTPEALARTLEDCGLSALAERMRGAEFRPSSACAVAGFTFDRVIVRDRGLVLGDACAMVPPFTGNGMAMAFTSAALALGPLVDWALHGESWEATTQRIHDALQREFQTRLNGAAFLHPLLLAKSGRACLGALARTGLLPLRPLYHLLH